MHIKEYETLEQIPFFSVLYAEGPEVHYENNHSTRSSPPDHGKSYCITSHSELGPPPSYKEGTWRDHLQKPPCA